MLACAQVKRVIIQDRNRYNLNMTFCAAVWILLMLCSPVWAQEKHTPLADAKVVTVPTIIDHNRVIIDVSLPLPDGSVQRVHAWVDNGNPDLELSRRLATVLGLNVTCDEKGCLSLPPRALMIGGLTIPLNEVKEVKIPLRPVSAAGVLDAGMDTEINIPSTVLRHYDVLIDSPGHKFTIGKPGLIDFQGSSSKVQINAENGLIQVPAKIENKKYNLALDLGSCISFLSDELFDQLSTAHADWPHMTGAVGSANMWGFSEEPKWKLMRIDRVQFGPLFLTNVAVVGFPKDRMDFFEKRAGIATAGLLGSEALLNYRVGLDYAHSTVYFDIGRMFIFPDFDVVGVILRPEEDGRYTIVGVADVDGKPSVSTEPNGVQPGDSLIAVNDTAVRGATMGQVWSLLGGTPGQERTLTIERAGRQFTVVAQVQHFLGEVEDDNEKKEKSKKH
jgi:hypothetical protein